MIGNAGQQQNISTYYEVDTIETFPKSTQVAGTTMTFDSTHPEVINITGWPLTQAQTIAQFGIYFWLFDNVNGVVSYGRWNLVGTTLSFLHVTNYPNFTTTLASGTAYAIPNRDVKNFDLCSVKCLSGTGVTVNGAPLAAQGSIITVERLGNANFPVIINATGASAAVSNMRFIN